MSGLIYCDCVNTNGSAIVVAINGSGARPGAAVRRVLGPVLSLCLMLLLPAAAWAADITRESLSSKLLGRDYFFSVYKPPGYSPDKGPYPVVYLLHGANGDENDWPVKGQVGPTLDRLIGEGKLQPMIVVMPGHKLMWWVDGNVEPAESVLFEELLPTVEQRYPVLKTREGRAIAGLSAGGHAAIRQALKRPQMFAAIAALSPAIYDPEPPANSSALKDQQWFKNGKFDKQTWARLNWQPLWDGYKNQPVRVPMYVNSGDHDKFDIVIHAARFYVEVRALQPGQAEFRVVDGDHEWPVWAATIGDAMSYLGRHMAGAPQ